MKLDGMGMPMLGFDAEAEPATLAQAWQAHIDACTEAFVPKRRLKATPPLMAHPAVCSESWRSGGMPYEVRRAASVTDIGVATPCFN